MGDETRRFEVAWRGGKLGRKGSRDPEKRMRMLEQERRWIIQGIRRASSTMEIDASIKEAMGLILRGRRGKGRGRTGIDSKDAILDAFCEDGVVQFAGERRMELTDDSPAHVRAIIKGIGEKVLRA